MRLRRKLLGRDFARDWTHRGESTEPVARGTRVLLEQPDGAEAVAYWHLLTDNGFAMEWCPGPLGGLGVRCPLLSSGHCELLESADVVVSALGIEYKPSRQILEAEKNTYPDTPVIVQASRHEFARWANELEGIQILQAPVTAPALLSAVRCVEAHLQNLLAK
jgi:hypothetical protein